LGEITSEVSSDCGCALLDHVLGCIDSLLL
jgi:hypothetical protein